MSKPIMIIDKNNNRFEFVDKKENRERNCEVKDINTGKTYTGSIFSISSSGRYVIELHQELED